MADYRFPTAGTDARLSATAGKDLRFEDPGFSAAELKAIGSQILFAGDGVMSEGAASGIVGGDTRWLEVDANNGVGATRTARSATVYTAEPTLLFAFTDCPPWLTTTRMHAEPSRPASILRASRRDVKRDGTPAASPSLLPRIDTRRPSLRAPKQPWADVHGLAARGNGWLTNAELRRARRGSLRYNIALSQLNDFTEVS